MIKSSIRAFLHIHHDYIEQLNNDIINKKQSKQMRKEAINSF